MKSKYLFLYISFFILLLPCGGAAYEENSNAIDLKQGWQYRWGDSPFYEGRPQWTLGQGEGQWQAIDFPSNPPGRKGQTNVWYRIPLPDDPQLGNSLYIFSIDLIAEVYLESTKIYSYGQFDEQGKGKFEGWPWHLIDLPRNYPGKYLYFRVFSTYPDIGLWGKVRLGTETIHIQEIFQEDSLRVASGLTFIFSALFLFLLAIYRKSINLLLMGLVIFTLGFESIHASQIKQLLLFAPLGWQYLGAANQYLFPIPLALLLVKRYGPGPYKIRSRVWQVHLIFLIYAMAAPLSGLIPLSSTFIHFDILVFPSLLILVATSLRRAKQGDGREKIVSLSLSVLFLFMLLDSLTAHDILPWLPQLNYYGQIFFALCLGIIWLQEYGNMKYALKQRSKELADLNRTLEHRIEKRTEELALLNQQKDRFFSLIAHDLRTPLNGFLGILQLLQMDSHEPKDQKDLLQHMTKAGNNMHRLLSNLLEWARLQFEEKTPQIGEFSLHKIASEALEDCLVTAQQKNIEIQNQLPDCRVMADKEMLKSVLRNLIHNGIKFSRPQDRILLEGVIEEDSILIQVKDEGVGMSPAHQEKLFHIGENVSKPGTELEAGSGLGLLLVKEMLGHMGGDIQVSSSLGKGSCFTLSLPLAANSMAAEAVC